MNYPPGNYAIVEFLGHRTVVGRIAEVERYGTKLLQLEAIFRDQLLPPTYHGGGSIYQETPCSAATAWAQQPKREWQLSPAHRAIVPPALLMEDTEGAAILDLETAENTDSPL